MGEQWVMVETKSGFVRVPAGSLIALASDPRRLEREAVERIERGAMAWSLGKFADLLWMLVPEFRDVIVELASKELREALDLDLFLTPVSDYALANRLHVDVLQPALLESPVNQDVLRRCFAVLRRLLTEETTNHYWDALNIEILRPLVVEGWADTLSDIDAQLMDIVRKKQT